MDFNEFESKMDKTISVLKESLSEIRAGRANPAILNKVSTYWVLLAINFPASIIELSSFRSIKNGTTLLPKLVNFSNKLGFRYPAKTTFSTENSFTAS